MIQFIRLSFIFKNLTDCPRAQAIFCRRLIFAENVRILCLMFHR